MPRRRERFRVHGMDCAEEVSLLRRELSGVAGVTELQFDVIHERMEVEFDPTRLNEEGVIAAVNRIGMAAEIWTELRPERPWRARLPVVETVLSFVAMTTGTAIKVWMQGGGILAWFAEESGPLPAASIACYAVAILVGFGPMAPKAWASLRRFRLDLNVLVAASLAGACYLGEWSEGASLSFLFALAGRIEQWSLNRARRAITSLFDQSPPQARVVHGDHEHLTDASRVPVGALVRVQAGERVPCDGEVTGGEALVNQALITGESVAVPKHAGGRVWAGTICEEGALEIRSTRAAPDTTIARIARMLGDSGRRRASSERTIERFARYYTPAVLAIAVLVAVAPPLVVGGAWAHWFYHGMVVLLIACPCALVISTPVTVAAALASAVRAGVLIKGGAFLEALASPRARIVAVDEAGEEPHDIRVAYGVHAVDAVLESADVVVLNGGKERLDAAIAHARRTRAVIVQNVGIALGLKLAFLAVAVFGTATLWMALVADMGATLLVTFNGLRMLLAKAEK